MRHRPPSSVPGVARVDPGGHSTHGTRVTLQARGMHDGRGPCRSRLQHVQVRLRGHLHPDCRPPRVVLHWRVLHGNARL
eukprot:COSAG01_NODE_2996_length_6742_cov_9.414421_5_plen_79_part_00